MKDREAYNDLLKQRVALDKMIAHYHDIHKQRNGKKDYQRLNELMAQRNELNRKRRTLV